MSLRDTVPGPPRWEIDWESVLRAARPWWGPLNGCPQHPVHHAEGDVATHTRLVAGALAEDAGWRALPTGERAELFVAALLHDVAKPQTLRVEDGIPRAPNHARIGSRMARLVLWEEDHPFGARERVAGLVANHQRPFHLHAAGEARIERELLRMSLECRLDHLTMLARADNRGRISPDAEETVAALDLFEEAARALGVWSRPYPFPDGLARQRYFSREAFRDHAWHDESTFELVILSGAPGAGKSTLRALRFGDLPAVSFDEIRRERGIRHSDPQREVVAEAMERLRGRFRAEESVILDTTALPRDRRDRPADLARRYGGRVRIVYVEASRERLLEQNRGRERVVPEEEIRRMLRRWEVPATHEAEAVEYWADGVQVPAPVAGSGGTA